MLNQQSSISIVKKYKFPSSLSMSTPTFSLKYKVLKPNPRLFVMQKSFHPTKDTTYQLSLTPEMAVRRYSIASRSIEQLLKICQWRYDAIPSVAHCYYIKLARPGKENRVVECEVFIEHMELAVREVQRLIIKECLYLARESAKGYAHLFSKFQRVSVNAESFGLNSQGQCIVWLQQDLSSSRPSFDALESETDVLSQIISTIQERSESASFEILGKIKNHIEYKRLNFKEFLQYLNQLIIKLNVQIPDNLKYLVNQSRIRKGSERVRVKTECNGHGEQGQLNTHRNQSKLTSNAIKQNIFGSPGWFKFERKENRLSQNPQFRQTIRATSSYEHKKFFTQKTINLKKQSYISTNFSSFIESSIKRQGLSRFTSKHNEEQYQKRGNYRFQKSKQRKVISKCRSQQSGSVEGNINIIKTPFKPMTRLNFVPTNKDQSREKEQGYFENRKDMIFSERNQSGSRKQSKKGGQKIYQSFVINLPDRLNQRNKCIGEQCQQHESSPRKQLGSDDGQFETVLKSRECPRNSYQMQEAVLQETFKANQWKKNLQSHSLWVQSNLNASINLGEEKSSYLADVKLEKLQMLSRQMAVSQLPCHDEVQPIVSRQIIE